MDVRRRALLWTVAACAAVKKKESRRKRKVWCKPWLTRCHNLGSFAQIFQELRCENQNDLETYIRMPMASFLFILEKITPCIQKEDTTMRDAISPSARLEACLIFLATGESYSRLQFSTRISPSSLSILIPETCQAIYNAFKHDFLKTPSSNEEWQKVAEEFNRRWNFPHCIGAVDGKHLNIVPPANNGSYFYNYKGNHSIVLMAVVDSNYEFIYVDIGSNGRASDGGVWGNCTLASAFEENRLGVPKADTLPNSVRTLPYVLVGDDAFPLKTYLMKPFPFKSQHRNERIFSYRLSRARRVVENAFGILANRFRVFLTTIHLAPAKVEKLVLASVVLHNYLWREHADHNQDTSIEREMIGTGQVTEGSWRMEDQLTPIEGIPRKSNNDAKNVREEFKKYFTEEGSVSWQENMI